MKRMLILGGGGFGRELASQLQEHPDCEKEWRIAGFLDRDTSLRNMPSRYPL